MRHSPLYSTYGAYQLKAAYQWNMLKSNLLILSTFTLLFIGLWIASLLAPPPVVIDFPDKDVIITRVDPFPQYSIKRKSLPFIDDRQTVDIPRVGIPNPIPEEEARYDNMIIPDRDQLRQMVDSRYEGIIGDSGNYTFSVEDIDDGLPEPDSFIAVDKIPEMVYYEKPQYPRMAKEMGLSGVVYIQALVDTDGSVLKVNVKKSSGVVLLDEAATEAAFKNKYSPAVRQNNPVRSWVVYKVVFELD